ncbi:Manganese transporter smf1 [Malassezia caprae]|uniref:Manganese transporter smf1 n=1 Tax=Malassezia caprae TaxID=1381934 RepID=A0AAF0IV81_9BASI|nr:Manganese transporter smf1 [Malassezia caprae]
MGGRQESTFFQTVNDTLLRHILFLGPGLIAAVAYCDPGNWATDMEAGSRFGYKLLFTVLLSGLFAVLLQILSCRLGAVTRQDLSVATRRLVLGLRHDSSVPDWTCRRTRLKYWCLLMPLYVINEVAILATELAELIGSAIALNLLFPNLPLWGGVLVTTADVFLVLFMYKPSSGVRLFEILIAVLVIIVLVCFCVLLERVRPDWGDVFYGYVPSATVVSSKGLYVSISILGATIMPHSLILGSHFATIERLEEDDFYCNESETTDQMSTKKQSLWKRLILPHVRVPDMASTDELPKREPISYRHLNLVLQHASWDIAICLVLFAITINSAILVVASAAFYYGHNSTGDKVVVADLFEAFKLLKTTTGHVPAILFAIALLAAGQSSSITVTLAGQIISEGFIHWRLTPLMRRLLTRSMAVIPAMIVACVAGRTGLDEMLVASQVALSMALPFVSFPLLVITCSPRLMTRELSDHVTNDVSGSDADHTDPATLPPSSWMRIPKQVLSTVRILFWPKRDRLDPDTGKYWYTFHNAAPIALLSWAVFLLICIADVYVLVQTLKDPSNA